MRHKCLPQEGLKLIAALTMLTDHIGTVFFPHVWLLRAIGRMAFPIYCFLLAEGAAHTKDPRRYGLRLLLGALLSEIPYDFLFYGGLTWHHQSVMLTLLFGFLMLQWMKRSGKVLPVLLCAAAAELLNTDYGGLGVVLIWMFAIREQLPGKWVMLAIFMAAVFYLMPTSHFTVFSLTLPTQLLGLGSLLPIALYSGQKQSRSPVIQWGFYLFYPVHLLLLFWIHSL